MVDVIVTQGMDSHAYGQNEFLISPSSMAPKPPKSHTGFARRARNIINSLRVGAKTLHRRGISHEKPEPADQPLHGYLDAVRHFASRSSNTPSSGHGFASPTEFVNKNYGSQMAASEGPLFGGSGRSSPTTESEVTHSLMSMSNGFTTGYTTERSSVYSFDDEFDKQNSQKVHQLFEEIDTMLFEENCKPRHLSNECENWTSVFPHLRILGEQIIEPQDLGYRMYPRQNPEGHSLLEDVSDHDMDMNNLSQGMNNLSIMGQIVHAEDPPHNRLSVHTGRGESEQQVEEEIFAQDGLYEEIVAIDKSTEDEYGTDKNMLFPRRKGKGVLPPVTPHACVKDNVSASVFDFVWSESINWLKCVLKQYNEQTDQMEEDEEEEGPLKDLPSSPNLYSGPLPPSREMSLTSGRDSSGKLLSRLHSTPKNEEIFRDILKIHSKPLHITKERSNLGEPADSPLNSSMARPGSSVTKFGRPGSVRTNDMSMRLNSARWRWKRLAPLDRAKTPNLEDERQQKMMGEVVRGKGLQVSERIGSPPLPYRNGPLPPLALDPIEQSMVAKGTTHLRKTGMRARASSAITEETRVPYQEREQAALQLNMRPSTTHTFRSDTPMGGASRRSSTPMGFSRAVGGLGFALVTSNTSPRTGDAASMVGIVQETRSRSESVMYQLPGSMRNRTMHGAFSATPAPSNVLQLNITGSGIMPHNESSHAHAHDVEDSVPYDDMLPTQWAPLTGLRRPKHTLNMSVR